VNFGNAKVIPTVVRIESYDAELIRDLYARTGVKIDRPNRAFFQDSRNILLVCMLGEEPAGYLYAYILPAVEDERPRCHIYSLDVFEEYRRRGLGIRLIEAVKAIAVQHKCRKVFCVTNKSNVAAVGLLAKANAVTEHDDDVVFVFR